MSMDAALWEEIGKIKDRLKVLEVRQGIRKADGTMVAAMHDVVAIPATGIDRACTIPEDALAKYRHR